MAIEMAIEDHTSLSILSNVNVSFHIYIALVLQNLHQSVRFVLARAKR
jgi:hypothetical protein